VKQPIKKSPEKLPMPKEEIVPDKTENTDEVYKKKQFINT
jgi:hypothetical protein